MECYPYIHPSILIVHYFPRPLNDGCYFLLRISVQTNSGISRWTAQFELLCWAFDSTDSMRLNVVYFIRPHWSASCWPCYFPSSGEWRFLRSIVSILKHSSSWEKQKPNKHQFSWKPCEFTNCSCFFFLWIHKSVQIDRNSKTETK